MSASTRRWPAVLFRAAERLSELAGLSSALLILGAVLVISYGVVLRYVVGASTVWQTELSIYFLIYASFVGAAYGLRHGDHVAVDLLVVRLPDPVREVVTLVAAVLGLLLVVVVAVLGFSFWWDVVESGRRSGTAWNPPLAYPYVILPVGMSVLALQYLAIVRRLYAEVRARGRGDGPAATDPAQEGAEAAAGDGDETGGGDGGRSGSRDGGENGEREEPNP